MPPGPLSAPAGSLVTLQGAVQVPLSRRAQRSPEERSFCDTADLRTVPDVVLKSASVELHPENHFCFRKPLQISLIFLPVTNSPSCC